MQDGKLHASAQWKVLLPLGEQIWKWEKMVEFKDLPQAKSCRRIDFGKVEIRPGIVNNTWILIVSGTKPWMNMKVDLVPLIYIQQPEYWGIEVVGRLPGIGLPAEAPYTVSIALDGITGTEGVEVIGATRSEKAQVPPRRLRQ